MKKLILTVLSILSACVMAFSFAACGTYKPATQPDPDQGKVPDDDKNNNNNNNNNQDDDKPFTATLTYDGKAFISEKPISAKWNDGSNVYAAEFGSDGVAKVDGLDGEFTVSLSAVPEGYTYNANIYSANNDKRDVEIELYKLNPYYGDGTDIYSNIILLNQLGAYRATFTESGQQLFCEYRPTQSGTYAIESILDINANEVNPRIDVYVGSSAWKPDKPTESLDGGGVSSVYTKNFKYEVNVAHSGNVYAFAIKFDKRSHVKFPINIDFMITRNGDFASEESSYKLALPTEKFRQTPEYSKSQYNFKYFGKVVGDRTVLDGSQVYLHSDGYYHYKYTDSHGLGRDVTLYVILNQPNSILQAEGGFQNTDVRLGVAGLNYEYFIRGYDSYVSALGGVENVPADALEKIKQLDYKSYIDFVNTDGAYPVTPELKDFLQAYSKREAFFLDGDGVGEQYQIDSSEADQWLFACGYYENR